MAGTTPSQTVGPFFSIALPWEDGPFVVAHGADGAIRLAGRVLDGEGEPVPDALVETWQAAPDGRYDAPGFRGFGRCPTDPGGAWEIVTLKPGRVDGQAPHVAVSVFARGLLQRVVTRVYFGDEPVANAEDPVLAALDERGRGTLVASPEAGGYRFDVHLQGPHETTFFAV
jgi:protocatechuate 3,4-dioxygenase, alpha subunit